MSMQALTILQIAYLAAAYLAVMVCIPAAVFYPFFEEKPLGVRFLAYLTIGNFYVINLVFLLQFLHISNRFTLILGILLPAGAAIGVIHWNSWMKNALTYAGEATYGVMLKTVGMRLILTRLFQALFSTLWKKLKNLFQVIIKHPVDILGTILVIAMVFWQYGTNVLTNFGYIASDTPVHNYWVNSLFNNKPFVAGVYPFGMHTVVYFFGEVFGMDVYNLFRIFGVLQDVLIHISLLIFLRVICRSACAAYASLTVYLGARLLNDVCTARMYNSIPQEYGMIFILPSVLFLFLFFESRREEKGSRGWKLDSTKNIAIFSMAFSLTLATHFYNTMILGLFCIATAIAFILYVFRKQFFWRILLFGILGILTAALPMGLAYVTGTPLEGSLRWGMSIMQTSQPDTTPQQSTGTSSAGTSSAGTSSENTQQQGAGPQQGGTVPGQQVQTQEGGTEGSYAAEMVVEKKSLVTRVAEKAKTIFEAMKNTDNVYISDYVYAKAPGVEFLMLLALFAFGILFFVLGERDYGCRLIAVVLEAMLLNCVMISKVLGIPALMDQTRCSTYLAYVYFAAFGLLLDCVFYVFFGWLKGNALKTGLALVCSALAVFGVLHVFGVRTVRLTGALEKNGAIICVTNILRENPPQTFTIVSANDELRMIERKGYFYEIIDLLKNNEGDKTEQYLTIPTPKIYFFVEKIPGEYGTPSIYNGQKVSRESAERMLPISSGLGSYVGTNRHIVMSKMYYWTEALQKLYRNEMSVYYEDEEFICYEMEQNVYRPFDLSIDYGYNYAGLTMPE